MQRASALFMAAVCAAVVFVGAADAQESGRIEGTVAGEDGVGIRGVTVVVNELAETTFTGSQGRFEFAGVPAGSYSVSFILGQNLLTRSDVEVTGGGSVRLDEVVNWEVGFAETIVVAAASRHPEKITDAPAAISYVSEEQIDREAAHGQLPKLLEFTPGAEVTQSGLYDYNFNTRGFNSSLNRRVATIIDGRDPSIPLLGAQEWAAVAYPLDDFSSVEFVRGPSAALYGANASSGVLDVITTQPRYSQGGQIRTTGGQLGTFNADIRYAADLGDDFYVKLLGGARTHDDFARSRTRTAEYSRLCGLGETGDCLPRELVSLERDRVNVFFGSVRVDKYLDAGPVLTLEGGYADLAGPVFQTGIGRVQVLDVARPWARFSASADRWNFITYYNRRKGSNQLALSSGGNLNSTGENFQAEAQGNWDLGDSARLVAGASYRRESVDSFDDRLGRQTLLFEPVSTDRGAVFAQVDLAITDELRFIAAGRLDASELHDTQVSPKAALVYRVAPAHSVRLTYNEAFQVANYSEFFLQAPVAPAADLRALNGFCAPFGVDCGFGFTPVLALGNEDLQVEEVRTFEIGYSGIVDNRARVTVDYYRSDNDNFITDLLPQLGTPLGRINPAFGPWQGPAGLPAPVAAAIRSAVPLLTNNFDGSNILGAVSYTNFGTVDTQGIDVGVSYFQERWTGTVTYSWFDFEIQESAPGLDGLLLPNSPEHKISASLSYFERSWDAGAALRWVDDFRWGVGPFQGDVESYATVDFYGNVQVAPRVSLGVNVSNLFDNEHFEAFGGDLLGRRALVTATYAWE